MFWRLAGQQILLAFFLIGGQLISYLVIAFFPGRFALQSVSQGVIEPSSSAGQLLLIASALATIASIWLAARVLDRRPLRNFGLDLSRRWWGDFLFGLSLGALLMALIFLVEFSAGWVRVEGYFHAPGARSRFLPALAAPLMLFVLIGFYEELFNRGYLIKNLAEGLSGIFPSPRWGIWAASLISSVFFGLLHALNPNSSLSSTINISLAGLFLAAGYLLTGQLAIPIGLHISWNFFQGNIFGFPVSGTSFGSPTLLLTRQLGPTIWTGGAFGPEAGLIGTLAMALGTGLILAWVKNRTVTIQFHPSLTVYHSHANQKQGVTDLNSKAALATTSTNKPPLDLVIWDWNGTLLDDLQLCLRLINQLLSARDLQPISRDQYREIFGFPVKDYYQRLGFDFNVEPFESISTEFITRYEKERPQCDLMPGAVDALSTVAGLDISQAIISASKEAYLVKAVREYGIDSFFQSVLGLDNHHAAGKSQLAADYIAAISWKPDRIMMIGDTTHDAAIADALGIRCLLIPSGHHSRARLAATGAAISDSLLEVPAWITHLKDA